MARALKHGPFQPGRGPPAALRRLPCDPLGRVALMGDEPSGPDRDAATLPAAQPAGKGRSGGRRRPDVGPARKSAGRCGTRRQRPPR
eukprot:1664518-Alexandrium_andersonii.AAC.1